MNLYTLEGITAQRGAFRLRIDELNLERGRVYALTGPNGCGKTTLLNLLAFLSERWQGQLGFCDERVAPTDQAKLLAHRRKIGYLMQNPYLFNTSVHRNVRYGLDVRGVPHDTADRRVADIAKELHLTHLLSANAHRLSGGEAQRVALARTLAIEPQVLLLDEPTANIDKQNIHLIEQLIRKTNTEKKLSVIMSTHSSDQACRMTNRILSIIDGKVADAAYENVFTGVLKVAQGGTRTVAVGSGVEFQVAAGAEGRVTVVINPADIILSDRELDSSALNRLHGPIAKTEDVNGSVRVFVNCGVVLCALVTKKSYVDLGLNIGKEIWATFKANAVKVI